MSEGGEKGAFTSENEGSKKRSKNYKKIIDDSMPIFSVNKTSADASRYRKDGKAAGLKTDRAGCFPWREAVGRVINKTKEIRANEIDTQSV